MVSDEPRDEPTTAEVLAEFYRAGLFVSEQERKEHEQAEEVRRARQRHVERVREFAYRAFLAASCLFVTFTGGRVYQAATMRGADLELVRRTIDNAQAALAVCTATDAELHALLEARAAEVWRVDP